MYALSMVASACVGYRYHQTLAVIQVVSLLVTMFFGILSKSDESSSDDNYRTRINEFRWNESSQSERMFFLLNVVGGTAMFAFAGACLIAVLIRLHLLPK